MNNELGPITIDLTDKELEEWKAYKNDPSLQEPFQAFTPALKQDLLKDLAQEILRQQREIIQSGGLRISVVPTDKIKLVFESLGIDFNAKF